MIDYIDNMSASILNDNGYYSYVNSPSDRIKIAAEQPTEIVVEVMAIWGDMPTIEEATSLPPMPSPTLPTPQEDADALLIGHEYRLTLLELGVS